MREKTVSRSREHSKDVALCGLFAALVAVGAFIKVVIPTGADTMNFTLQWFFEMPADYILCILAAIMARRLRPMVQAYL